MSRMIGGVREHRLSYRDALIWATAKLNRIPVILTEDLSTGALIEGVRILDPLPGAFDFDSLLPPSR